MFMRNVVLPVAVFIVICRFTVIPVTCSSDVQYTAELFVVFFLLGWFAKQFRITTDQVHPSEWNRATNTRWIFVKFYI